MPNTSKSMCKFILFGILFWKTILSEILVIRYDRLVLNLAPARRGGAEVAGWTLDRKIRVRFPAYPHRVWALWWQGGKRRLQTSRCPCWGRLGTLKTPSCPWRKCPAAGQNLETGHLSRHYIAEISLNVTLNHKQQTKTTKLSSKHLKWHKLNYIVYTLKHLLR